MLPWLIVPSGNLVCEDQVRRMVPATVGLHVTRLPLTGTSEAALKAMTDRLDEAARLLADARVDLIAFNCTAVSTMRPGSDTEIAAQIEAATQTPAVTTGTALVEALRRLNAGRIVLVTPYIAAVVEREAAFFRRHGFEVLDEVGAGIDTNWDMAHAPAQTWYDLTLAHRHPEAHAYVLSCTAIHSAEVIAPLERELGRPVLTSNQVLSWFSVRSAGVAARVDGYGRLLSDVS
jgi:maleate isomerase